MAPLTPLVIAGWHPLKDLVESAIHGVLKYIADNVAAAARWLIINLYAGFLRAPTPGVGSEKNMHCAPIKGAAGGSKAVPGDCNSFTDVALWTNQHLLWLSVFVATLAVAVAGGKLAWNYTHGYHESLRNILTGLVTLVVANLVVVQAVRVLLLVGDKYTNWIINKAAFQQAKDTTFLGDAIQLQESYLLFICMGGFVILSMLIQLILMMFRGAMLVLLAGTIVLPAATATSETGRKWLNRYLSWMIAFICFKPAAATVYAVAFRLIFSFTNPSQPKDIFSVIAGMVLLGSAVLVLPALLRLLTPVAVALAGSAAGAGGGQSSDSSSGSSSSPSGSSEPAQASTGNNQSSQSGSSGGVQGGPSGAASAEMGKSAGGGKSSGGSGSSGGSASTPKSMPGGGSGGGGGGIAGGGGSSGGAAGGSGAGAAGGAAAGAATGGATIAAGAAMDQGKQAFDHGVSQIEQETNSDSEGPAPNGAGGGTLG